jgi:hypothetical protein
MFDSLQGQHLSLLHNFQNRVQTSSYIGCRGTFSPGEKRQERLADNWPSSGAEIKTGRAILVLPLPLPFHDMAFN